MRQSNFKKTVLIGVLSIVVLFIFIGKKEDNKACFNNLKNTYSKEKLISLVKDKPIQKSYCSYVK